MSNETNVTVTESPTMETTQAPVTGSTTAPTTDQPTVEPTVLQTTGSPTQSEHVDVIRLPDYKSHDTVDGFFLGVGSFIMLVFLVLCLQRINLNRRRLSNRID